MPSRQLGKHIWRVVLHLGSNQGERLTYLREAIALIRLHVGEVIELSGIYETAAWGRTDQEAFYNLALIVETALSPFDLLDCTQGIERHIGRNKTVHWGPRNIDIDILYIDDLIVHTPRLQVPHSQLHIRNFVLYPLREVDNDGRHPIFACSNEELFHRSPDDGVVKRLNIQADLE